MQQSRQGMRVGRAKFRAGDVDLAIHIWMKALESAYTTQDYAVMYVLSKNLGDAFGQLAKEQQQLQKQTQQVATAVIEALQKSIDYYKYALGVIDECALLDVLGDESHLVLNRSAGYVHATLKRQEMEMEKLHKLPPAIEEQPCTTCEELFEHLVLDNSDGCLYCQECYDAFYVSVESAEFNSSPANLAVSAAVPPPVSMHEFGAAAGSSISELPEAEENVIEELSDAVANSSSFVLFDEATKDVETVISTVSASFEATKSHPEAIEMNTSEAAASLEQANTTPHVQAKQVYSIPELLALRTQSPVDSCPKAILSSPVARSSDSEATNSGTRPADRKNPFNKQSKSSNKSKQLPVIHASKTSPPRVSFLSALPPVELCSALRDAASGAFSMADVQKIAASLFDSGTSGSEPNGETGGDATLASSPCHEGAFVADLPLFATVLKQ